MLTSPSGNNGLERLNLGMLGPRGKEEKNVTFIPSEVPLSRRTGGRGRATPQDYPNGGPVAPLHLLVHYASYYTQARSESSALGTVDSTQTEAQCTLSAAATRQPEETRPGPLTWKCIAFNR